MTSTPPPNSVEIEAKRLLRDLSHCPETAKEPLIWNALNSQRRSALEEALKLIASSEVMPWDDGDYCLSFKSAHAPFSRLMSKTEANDALYKVILPMINDLRSLLEVKG